MAELVPASGLAAWRNFLKAHSVVLKTIERNLESQALVPLTWYDVLIAISSAPAGRLRMRSLADELVLTRTNATRLADRLEAAGLITRERAEEDRRGAVAVLTPAGKRALRRAWPVYAAGISELFLAQLSDRDVRVMATAMGRIATSVQSRTARPGAPRLRDWRLKPSRGG